MKVAFVEKGSIISFFDNDYLEGFDCDHDDLMVIIVTIHNYTIKRIFIYQRSSTNILYSVVVASVNIQKRNLRPYTKNLIRFFGKLMFVKDTVKLRVTLET